MDMQVASKKYSKISRHDESIVGIRKFNLTD